MSDKVSSNLLDYENPPLSEVVCGVRFKTLESFLVPHYGNFWDKVKNEFPLCEHAQPLYSDTSKLPNIETSAPRVWLINKPGDMLIQLQNDRFLFNWRKTENNPEYPRFSKIFSAFSDYFELFTSFIEKEDIGTIEPLEYELSYINIINQGEGWDNPQDIGHIMKDISWEIDRDFLPPPIAVHWQTFFYLPDKQGRLDVSLKQAQRKSDLKPVFRLELSTKGIDPTKELSDLSNWFELAHKWIVSGFSDLTTNEIQNKLWGKK